MITPCAYPHIARPHIDGRVLVLRDGRSFALSWLERLQLWSGYTDTYLLERKHRKRR